MNDAKTYDEFEAYEQLPVSSQRTFPAAPFPHKYVHCVIDDLYYVVEAVHALQVTGYDDGDIHVMASWDFVEAVARRQQRQGLLSKALTCLYSFIDEGFGNMYLHEAMRGRHILAVRLSRNEQMEQVGSCAVCVVPESAPDGRIEAATVPPQLPFESYFHVAICFILAVCRSVPG